MTAQLRAIGETMGRQKRNPIPPLANSGARITDTGHNVQEILPEGVIFRTVSAAQTNGLLPCVKWPGRCGHTRIRTFAPNSATNSRAINRYAKAVITPAI